MPRPKLRVLIVDDSPMDRELLLAVLEEQPDMEVVGQAADSYEAREKVRLLSPDVLTLDVSMPGMSGLTFLRNLMRLRPMPVVMCSALTEAGADATLEALAVGAVDFIAKPSGGAESLADYRTAVVAKVRAAAYARVRAFAPPAAAAAPQDSAAPRAAAAPGAPDADIAAFTAAAGRPGAARGVDVVAIGASTGGVTAIQELLESVPAGHLPPIVITQHIPAGFSRSFARRLDAQLPHAVHEAEPGMPLEPGHVYVAPGGHQFAIRRAAGGGYHCVVEQGQRVNLHRPSVDVLFHSVARQAGHRAVGVMLTGMGSDGARGMRAMRDQGAYNIVQDKASSLVWGMPGAAAEAGAAHAELPLARIGPTLCEITGSATRSARHG
jgi:two-component system chemotaxis response regulator CheB